MGYTPPSPKVPFIYDKFLTYMKGAGINVQKDGHRLHLFALTDKDISKFSSGEIKSGNTITGDRMEEIPGGLFDRQLTGGHGGDRWAHISLTEPLPNPVMEEPIRHILGLTQKGLEEVIAGKKDINGKVGGAANKEALARINLDASIEHAKTTIRDGSKAKRDAAVKVLGYLEGMKKHDIKPTDLMMSKVPVIPPSMRPITGYKSMIIPADANLLYKDLILANGALKDMQGVVGDVHLGNERLQLYNSFKAVTGMGDPIQPKLVEKGVSGLLEHVFGKGSPKTGMFQRRVLGSPVDIVGRATITPNPELNMDQVGLPEPKAWTIYRPFIVRRLIRHGMPATEAAKAVSNQTDVARKAMLEEIKDRPVIINRAPTLHRYGFMAAWPVLTKGETLQIPPVVCGGFGADFDGDAMNYHVPVTEGAVKDAIEKMMPSRNLKSVRDFKVHYTPKNEFLMGLHLASTADNKNEPRVFKDKASAIAAYKRGDIDLGDRVVIRD
jgi:DNA-directed RNA polymerase subunit beta'